MHDWNRDGHTDAQDSFIDYQIYNETTRPQKPRQTADPGARIAALIVCGIIAVVLLILAR